MGQTAVVMETLHATTAVLTVVRCLDVVVVVFVVIVLVKIVVTVHLVGVLDVDMLMSAAAASTCTERLLK